MRFLLILLLVMALPLAALASDCGCEEEKCCAPLISLSKMAKQRSTSSLHCLSCGGEEALYCFEPVCHKPLALCDPGGGPCLIEACHKPLMTCEPCGELCLERVCHKPVVGMLLEDCVDCEVPLTGERPSGCDCADCSADAG